MLFQSLPCAADGRGPGVGFFWLVGHFGTFWDTRATDPPVAERPGDGAAAPRDARALAGPTHLILPTPRNRNPPPRICGRGRAAVRPAVPPDGDRQAIA